ncbi:MAG: hypothetical protein ACRDWE_12355 [Acidimicrobiales bacterium]
MPLGVAGQPGNEGARVVPVDVMAAADRLEAAAVAALEEQVAPKSVLYVSGDVDPRQGVPMPRGRRLLIGDDPRLAAMPAAPALGDFFALRFGPASHLLQSARRARESGCEEKVVLACLLHDIAVIGFIRADHGFWAAQLLEPYVDAEVAWAIRMHQVLRFFPDEEVGYEYPQMYVEFFGEDFEPPGWLVAEYERARRHRWYMTARQITLNDEYSFDPNSAVSIDEFTDVVGRHFRQPTEGLGYDGSPSAHMWRTIIAPTRCL